MVESFTIAVQVPDHDELRFGTLQSIIRQSELPRLFFEESAAETQQWRY